MNEVREKVQEYLKEMRDEFAGEGGELDGAMAFVTGCFGDGERVTGSCWFLRESSPLTEAELLSACAGKLIADAHAQGYDDLARALEDAPEHYVRTGKAELPGGGVAH